MPGGAGNIAACHTIGIGSENSIQIAARSVARSPEVNFRTSDDEILTWAVSEGRIIITTDSNFEQMIGLEGRSHGGVLRLENLPRLARKMLCQAVLANHAQDRRSRGRSAAAKDSDSAEIDGNGELMMKNHQLLIGPTL